MRSETTILPGVRKIPVLRANGIGDLVVSLPALAALRAAYEDAEIVLLGTPEHEQLLTGRAEGAAQLRSRPLRSAETRAAG